MEEKLLEAAYTGNVGLLQQILKENPLILHTTALVSAYQYPLHIASVAGHVDFVREVVRLKPDLGRELNQDGFSALHLASANGNLEVVREIVKADHSLCRIQGRGGLTPLHVAATRGKVDVICEIVSACTDSLEDVTVQKESALHLAVKYNQFEAFKAMVESVKEMDNMDKILNIKDELDNTILHLAAWRKHRQAVELLLGSVSTTRSSNLVDINAINQNGLTALDVLLTFPSEAGDTEIAEILRRAGASRARETITNPTAPTSENQQNNDPVEYFKFKRGRDSPSEARSALLVISVLVATATFQVGISPPGGVWQDSSYATWNPNNGTSHVDQALVNIAGRSIMGSLNALWFTLFALFNSIGFTMSICMIDVLTKKFPLQLELQICLTAMFFTYSTAMVTIAPDGTKTILTVVTSVLPTMLPLLIRFSRPHINKIRRLVPCKIRRIICHLC